MPIKTSEPSELDKAVIAYRNDPTETNRARLMYLQEQHMTRFFNSQTIDYQLRTR